MTRGDKISLRGSWPGAVILRQGWARAHARPWNDDSNAASLRFDRGSAGFLAGCIDALGHAGADGVLSVPLYRRSLGLWNRAGFGPHRELLLLERRLDGRFRESRPKPISIWSGDSWLEPILRIDNLAFDLEWRLGRLGLIEASRAASSSVILTDGVPHSEPPTGFAIAGVAGSIGYLQRLAVAPEAQGTGLGRDLVMASLRWARGRGGRSMLVNTQPENRRSITLYTAMGFNVVPERLSVLRAGTRTSISDPAGPLGPTDPTGHR